MIPDYNDAPDCPACGNPDPRHWGPLGDRYHYQCQQCGTRFYREIRRRDDD